MLAGDAADTLSGETGCDGGTGCGAGAGCCTAGGETGAAELCTSGVELGTGKVTSPEPLTSPVEGTVEIGGTPAAVVESTSGMALATPTAPVARMPIPSADAAVIETQRGAGGMSDSFRVVVSLHGSGHDDNGLR